MGLPDMAELIASVSAEADSDDPLVELGAAVRRRSELDDVAESLLDHFIERARSAGCSWSQIGAELGVTKQAAQQRHTNEQSVARRLLARILPFEIDVRRDRHRVGLDDARQVFVAAQTEAQALGQSRIGTEHLLLAILRDEATVAALSLASLGVSYQAVRDDVMLTSDAADDVVPALLLLTPRANKVLELSLKESSQMRQSNIGPEHLLLGIAKEDNGRASSTLRTLGVDGNTLRAAVLRNLHEDQGGSVDPDEPT